MKDDDLNRMNDEENVSQEKAVEGKDFQVAATEQTSTTLHVPIQKLSCPVCDAQFEENCEDLEKIVICPKCGREFPYVDGYLLMYRPYIEMFIDNVHPIPLVPGYSTAGEVMVPPDELLLVPFSIEYYREPEVFFLLPGNKAAREWIHENQVFMPLSVSKRNFILFSKTFDKSESNQPVTLKWMAIGEYTRLDKPLWLNYLQNSADLVRNDEDVAAIVMLLISLDFFYDYILARCEIGYDEIRRVGRRPGMNEKKAKLKLIHDRMGDWSGDFGNQLKDLTDFRNKIVHNVVKRPDVRGFTGRRAFQIVMRAILFLIEMYHRSECQNGVNGKSKPAKE